MARQDGRIPVHYAPEGVALCVVGRRHGVEVTVSEDPRETSCGQCERIPAWKQAWREEAERAAERARA